MTLKFHTVRIGLQFMLRTHTGLLVLRKAIAANPNSFQAKLSAIELYSSIGAAAAALPLWESLRVRFIQADTLSFMLLPELAAGGFISQVSGVSLSRPFSHSSLILPTLTLRIHTFPFQASELCHDTIAFHRKLRRDMEKNAWLALNEGNMPSVLDFAAFREKMGKSLQLAQCSGLCGVELYFPGSRSLFSPLIRIPFPLDHHSLLFSYV